MLSLGLDDEFLEMVKQEAAKAREKFPTGTFDVGAWLALTEEVGELNQAILQREQELQKWISKAAVLKEAVQVATMAMRVIMDTDAIA